jgi:threonyl-tRNA synthetase
MKIWDIVDKFYSTFGFTLKVRLSFRDPNTPEKYLGTKEIWDYAENALREIAEERNADHFEGPGEAALYGPKLDFMATNAAGREWQVATIQLDMNLPERFDLSCINEKGEKERIVMIHSAITGSIERCIGILLEHLEGILPLWLSPVQVKVLPIGESHFEYAEGVLESLKSEGIRAEIDESNESLGKKIANFKKEKVPYALVIGDKEVEDNKVTIESRDKGKQGQSSMEGLISKLKEEIKERL